MTIRDIAALCGVSAATVDRVINGRGKVRPDTEKRILAALSKAGYSKNIAARALAIRKDAPRIGVLVSALGNPFFDEVLLGIQRAEGELSDFGISIALETMRGYHVEEQLQRLDALAPSLSALVLQPIDHPLIAEKIAHLSAQGIPAITLNSDLEGSLRRCYVGSDYTLGGQAAAGLMRLATHGERHLGILTGVHSLLGHRQRLSGFESHLTATCPRIRIAAKISVEDDDDLAYAATLAMLKAHPEIDTLQLIAAGLEGVCRAVRELGQEGRIALFAFDQIPKTKRMMALGLLRGVVCQQPFQQGYQALRAAMDIILSGEPGQEKYIMENQIRILENLSGEGM